PDGTVVVTDPSAEPKKEAPSTTAAVPGVARVKVILDGREHELEIGPKGDPILDTAINAGLDVPYACKGAVCCTCKARVIEGKVEMDMNYALTDEEVADGYVLTCQARPRSARVVVDYDQH
ncbi:MAG TPA: 2Fe-2S iron-sulfur cluster-binding protein, partial [Flavobacteriales bacterium]|nr:2Fe-2S iron-sulfur cluster-binding protein [Flavobacteriales bacterium]